MMTCFSLESSDNIADHNSGLDPAFPKQDLGGKKKERERERNIKVISHKIHRKKIKIKNEQNQCLFFHQKNKIVF